MKPIRFSIRSGVTHFHYKPSEIIEFVRMGKANGNVGMILTRREGIHFVYRGFGTIEHPRKVILTFSFPHVEQSEGKMPTDESLIQPE